MFRKPQTAHLTALNEVALMIVKKNKSFMYGEFIKKCAVKMA